MNLSRLVSWLGYGIVITGITQNICSTAWAQNLPPQQVVALIAQTIHDPDNVNAYLQLARHYQALGQSENAKRLYQKALLLDPNNAEAKSALGQIGRPSAKGATYFELRLGMRYEDNAVRRDNSFLHFDDVSGFGEIRMIDLRPLGKLEWQTEVDLFGVINNRYSPGDLGYGALNSGPVFQLESGAKVRVALGIDHAAKGPSPRPRNHDRELKHLFTGYEAIVSYLPATKGAWRRLDLSVGYYDFVSFESFRSGPFAMLQAPFLFQSNLPWNGKFQLIPRAKYIGANEGGFHQAAEFYELGFSSLYLVPLDWSAITSNSILYVTIWHKILRCAHRRIKTPNRKDAQ